MANSILKICMIVECCNYPSSKPAPEPCMLLYLLDTLLVSCLVNLLYGVFQLLGGIGVCELRTSDNDA